MLKKNFDPFEDEPISPPAPVQTEPPKPSTRSPEPVPVAASGRTEPVEAPGNSEPPHEAFAEAAACSCILTTPDAFVTLHGQITADDFFLSRCRTVFETCEALFKVGKPINPVAVASELKAKRGLESIGGFDYLAELVSMSVDLSTALDCAKRIRAASVVRSVITASYETISEAYQGVISVDEFVTKAEGRLMSVSQKREQKRSKPIAEIAAGQLQVMQDRHASGTYTTGISTGISTIDEVIGGLRPGEFIVLAGRPSMGKAQPFDAQVLTPAGYRNMGDLRVGDEVTAPDGKGQSFVTAIYPQGVKQVFRVTLSDGRSTEACAEHLWLTGHYTWVDPKLIDTAYMAGLWKHDRFRGKLKLPIYNDARKYLAVKSIVPTREVDCQCIAVSHPSHLYVTDGGIITHNTAATLNIAMNAALAGKRTLFCSLEMSEAQLMNRAYCLLTGVEAARIQSVRYLARDDWDAVRDATERLTKVPLWIDDQPAISMMDLRTKCLKLKQAGGLDLVIVDYLQLMTPFDRKVSREQQVSGLSAGLKALSKDMNLPVIGLSQLSRKCEERPGNDKRPQLSDLRECVTGDTLVTCGDGQLRPIASLVGTKPLVQSMYAEGRTITAQSDKVWEVGVKPVFNLTTTSGRRITATGGHRFKCWNGWVTLENLHIGDRIAIVRTATPPEYPTDWPVELIAFLGQMIGDGSYLKHQPVRFTTSDPDNAEVFRRGAELLGCTVTAYEGRRTWKQYVASGNGNRWHQAGIRKWLSDLGIYNQRSHEKHLPSEVFTFSNKQIALLLRHLWATDGTFSIGSTETTAINYSTTSRRLADEITYLLSRFGIVGRIATTHKKGYRDTFHVQISGGTDQLIFCRTIGAFGRRIAPMEKLLSVLEQKTTNTNVDTLPIEVWQVVRAEMQKRGITTRKMAELRGTSYGGMAHFNFAPSRETIRSYAELLSSDELKSLATDNDVFWDSVKSIEPAGEQMVYDLTVPGFENWQANGIVTHNSGSIEQDSDIVMFLYRPEYYYKGKEPIEEDQKGLLEILIEKNRNGDTGTALCTFRGATMTVTARDKMS